MKSVNRVVMSLFFCLAFGFCSEAIASLTPPKPSASDGTYTSYVYLSWSKVTGAKKYWIYRGTSSTFSYATSLASTTSTYYYDNNAKAGTYYYYWILPVDSNNKGWYIASRYDSGYKASSGALSFGYCPSSIKVGKSDCFSVKYGSSYVKPTSITISNNNASVTKYSTLLGTYCGQVKGLKAGTATLTCKYAGETITRTITITNSTPSPSPLPTPISISGPSTVRFGQTVYYKLYAGGKNVTSSATWKSGLYMTAYKGGRYYVGNPPRNGSSTTIYFVYNGKTYSKIVYVYKK